jgi:hypothetical protein
VICHRLNPPKQWWVSEKGGKREGEGDRARENVCLTATEGVGKREREREDCNK